MGEVIAFIVPLMVCATVFIGIGIYSIKRKTPMHFWSGTIVRPEEISDVKSYNKENGIMWIVYGSTYILSAIVSLFWRSSIGTIIVGLSASVGIIVLILVYQRIYKKYKV
ncbi:hypothetical protein SAMN05192551_12010 [Tindallia magadiensis]|uniref:SdpI/YhfL protein family protein n=1 Tax=Tindallia magadiensis TaxID=69895 RepID=A0A1I3I2D4_9FIRM|nr:hypothetical protein [Tindallia magadiensis]SFI42091.1 hypothetical protein SAMN05192551_12010 [Tindallia magadiensis]